MLEISKEAIARRRERDEQTSRPISLLSSYTKQHDHMQMMMSREWIVSERRGESVGWHVWNVLLLRFDRSLNLLSFVSFRSVEAITLALANSRTSS